MPPLEFCPVSQVRDYPTRIFRSAGPWGGFSEPINAVVVGGWWFGTTHPTGWISETHIQRYLDEFQWCWNRHEMGEGQRVNAILDQVSGRLTYQELIA